MNNVRKMNTIWTICLVLWCMSLFFRTFGLAETIMLGISSAGVILGLIPLHASRNETSTTTKLLYGMFLFLVVGKFLTRIGVGEIWSQISMFLSALFFFVLMFKCIHYLGTYNYKKELKELEEHDDSTRGAED